MNENLNIALGLLLAYLAGSIPTSVWVGRIFYGIDIRTQGSGNAGATNTLRILGWKAGVPVMVVDVLKGWFAVYLYHFFAPDTLNEQSLVIYKIALAAMAVIGHVFPVFAGFRGGKGIATLLGVGIALYPAAVLVVLGIFFLILLISGYVSLSSIIAAISFPLIVAFLFNPESLPLLVLAVCVGLFIPVTHRKNIGRLLKGTESKFRIKKTDKSKKK
jgi:glycerol-3-phosphate acyltransferase PlsY